MAQGLAVQAPATLVALRVVINYIHGGPVDKKYNSKWKKQRLLRVASVREHISFIQHNLSDGGVCPVDDTITFPR